MIQVYDKMSEVRQLVDPTCCLVEPSDISGVADAAIWCWATNVDQLFVAGRDAVLAFGARRYAVVPSAVAQAMLDEWEGGCGALYPTS